MAIQKINLGTEPLGEGGDTYRSANTKVNENFSNKDHAASKLVGTGNDQLPTTAHVKSLITNATLPSGSPNIGTVAVRNVGTAKGQVPLAEDTYEAAFGIQLSTIIEVDDGVTPDKFSAGSKNYVRKDVKGMPKTIDSDDSWYVETKYINASASKIHFQEAVNLKNARRLTRVSSILPGYNTTWRRPTKDEETYTTTSASSSNVVVNAAGDLMRASSSLKYKDVIKNLELDSDLYDKAISIKPIVYRSKSEVDPKEWHYMSFIAEELGEIDPSLAQWFVKTHDDDGNELDEPIKEAEGINLNAICAVLHATNIYQDKKIKELEQRLTALESINAPEPESK